MMWKTLEVDISGFIRTQLQGCKWINQDRFYSAVLCDGLTPSPQQHFTIIVQLATTSAEAV